MKSPLSTHYPSGIAGAAFKSSRISSLIFDALLLVVPLSLPGWASSVLYSQPSNRYRKRLGFSERHCVFG